MNSGRIGRRSVLGGAGLLLTAKDALGAERKPRVSIQTGHGLILAVLEVGKAPLTCANFLRYVEAKDYDGGSFYRAARAPGAPTQGTIVGGPQPKTHPFAPIAHESTTMTGLRHTTGTISLGRFAPGSATDNFFICASPEPYLDAHPGARGDNLGYAAFGHVVEGMAVVRKILSLPTNGKSQFADQKGQWLNPPVPILSMRRIG